MENMTKKVETSLRTPEEIYQDMIDCLALMEVYPSQAATYAKTTLTYWKLLVRAEEVYHYKTKLMDNATRDYEAFELRVLETLRKIQEREAKIKK